VVGQPLISAAATARRQMRNFEFRISDFGFSGAVAIVIDSTTGQEIRNAKFEMRNADFRPHFEFRVSNFAFLVVGVGRLNLVFSDVKLRPLN
jgi:hypothetical protein